MTNTVRQAMVIAVVGFMTLWSCVAWAEMIGAKALLVRGKVAVHPADGGPSRKLELGDTVMEGDRIVTGTDGIVEIRFDNGDLIRIDHETDLGLSTLRKNPSGTRRSVFDLTVGRVKSWVSKLLTSDSQFDYHTKAAVAGVAGTPPFIVSYDPATDTTEVDLLGAEGDEGKVFVQGRDPAATRKLVFPMRRTVIVGGKPPVNPYPIEPERLRQFEKTIPFESVETDGTRRGDDESPGHGVGQSGERRQDIAPVLPGDIALETASRIVSQPPRPAPGWHSTTMGIMVLTAAQQGSVGAVNALTAPSATASSTVSFGIDIGF